MSLDIHIYHHFHGAIEQRADCAIIKMLATIIERLNTMPTNEDLSAKLAELETALTEEIQQVADALSAAGVSQENVDRVTALIDRVKGIVAPA